MGYVDLIRHLQTNHSHIEQWEKAEMIEELFKLAHIITYDVEQSGKPTFKLIKGGQNELSTTKTKKKSKARSKTRIKSVRQGGNFPAENNSCTT